MGVNLLFTVGGDGTQRGAHAIAAEAQRRRLPLADSELDEVASLNPQVPARP
jgi:hypothetical protein